MIVHLFDRVEIFDHVAPAPTPAPRARHTPAEIAGTRPFDKQLHIREMAGHTAIPVPLNLRPRSQRGITGLVRRLAGAA